MAGAVKVVGDKVIIGTATYKRIPVHSKDEAVRQSAKAALDIKGAGDLPEHFFKNGTGRYVEVHGSTPNITAKVVCNALYDCTTGKPVGYIRFASDRGRSDSDLPQMATSFYSLNKDTSIVTFF
ncbi:MAG: hypothetical protein OEZ39_00860 [Gammaproteobacteria bacterium]|nr:hypothetical protein [Gammaproteobacteria bacterium]MDH5650400.1 hypothetical protein [Gammaproteobacteria bacterium]